MTPLREIKVALLQPIWLVYRGRFLEELSKRLARKGFRLTVFFGKPQRGIGYSESIPSAESSLFNFNYKILPKIAYEGKLPTSPFHWKRALVFFPSLIFEITRGKYDVTISDTTGELLNTLPLLIVNKFLLGKKFIVWCGNNIKDNALRAEDSFIKKVAYVFARLIYRNVDASIAYGPGSKEFDMYMGTPPEKIFTAWITIDTQYFQEATKAFQNQIEPMKRTLGIEGKGTVLYVGILEKRKKLENLILAFKELQKSMDNIALLLVGDGPHRGDLQNLCVKEKISDVHFLGKISYNKIPLLYALSDVFVLPAQGGIAVAEAMASGKPVIITEECNALRSIPNLFRHGESGFILKKDDIASLAEHMGKILSSPVLASKIGTTARAMAEQHISTEKMLHGFEQALDYVFAKK
jgi:glycosyltransferase involved in cell wall biosynthesis